MDLKVQIHICAQGAVQMKPILVICQIFELPSWFLNVFISYNPLRKKRRSVPIEKTQVHWNVDSSRGFWKENIAWGQREEKGTVLLVSQKATVISGPRELWGKKEALVDITKGEKQDKGKEKENKTEETPLLQGTWAYGDIWLMSRHFCDFQWVHRLPSCLPPPPSIQQISLSTCYMPGNAGHCGWSLWIKGHAGLCPSSIPGTTNNSCILGCHSSLRKSCFTKHSPES